MNSIIILEDHPIMREGLASFFSGTGRWNVKGGASTIEEAKALLKNDTVDVALLDIQLKEGWGLEIIPFLKEQDKKPLIAVYSNFDDYAHVSTALTLGVRAYVTKQRNQEELEEALLTALSGSVYIDEAAEKKQKNTEEKIKLLSNREKEIFELVKAGLSNKEIAGKLFISHRTVANIVSCIYDKIGIRSRLELERL
jgi:DNA-binding NarL/FixJ family response regulator